MSIDVITGQYEQKYRQQAKEITDCVVATTITLVEKKEISDCVAATPKPVVATPHLEKSREISDYFYEDKKSEVLANILAIGFTVATCAGMILGFYYLAANMLK